MCVCFLFVVHSGVVVPPKGIDRGLAGQAAGVVPAAIRNAGPDDLIIADGTSCRCQIKDGAQRTAKHVALVLDSHLKDID